MKTYFHNTLLPFLFTAVLALSSCSDNDVTINPTASLTKIADGYAFGAGAKVEVWAEEELFAGYNKLYIALYDSLSNKRITESHVHLNPVMDMHTMSHSCPAENPEEVSTTDLFAGAILFTMPSGEMGSWSLNLLVHNHLNNRSGKAVFPIDVKAKTSSAALSFVEPGSNKKYYLGYHFPEGMKVGINDFEVVAYTFSGGAFIPEENLQLKLNPEMPSMDHGSPNNVSPIHSQSGHYVGKVNFTMTGEWRLNLTLSDADTELGVKYFDVTVK
jgi:hypothetical protein